MCGRGRVRRSIGMIGMVSILAGARPAGAADLWSSGAGDRYLSANLTLKSTSLLSRAPEDTTLFPERWSASALTRGRLILQGRPVSWLKAEAAYEQRTRHMSEGSGAGGGSGVLFSETDAAYRLEPLDDSILGVGETYRWRHELDRASIALSLGGVDLKIGRQAIGWGRGLMFSAVDIFAPFTPLEVDREWRRGVDAVRGTLPLSDLFSMDLVAAFGESEETSAFALRVHGYVGSLDGEIIVGRRYSDTFYAATASLPVWDAELHGEVALFNTPETLPHGNILGREDLAAKSVIGGSYSVDVGMGILVAAEHHFSGFGVGEIGDLETRLEDPAFRDRALRGDTQIMGRHAGVLQVSYGISTLSPGTLSWIFSPTDGSGVLIPSITWAATDWFTVAASAYVAHGADPEDGRLRSEYGATPTSGLVQISFYY